MDQPIKSPRAATGGLLQSSIDSQKSSTTTPPPKWKRVLAALAAGRSLNRWEAARELRDWCLHSTVAGLETRGLRIDRSDEVIEGHFGPIHCKRYRINPASLDLARRLLNIPSGAPE